MFRGQKYTTPHYKSLAGALFVTIVVMMLGSKASPMIGYFSALSALVIIVVAMQMQSIWPTEVKKENVLVFSLFWGLMLGAIVPFLIDTYIKGGVSAVYNLLASTP